jgi:hypothetical protein
MTITRKFNNDRAAGARRLSFNAKSCTLFLVHACGFQSECLRREKFATVDAARAAWAEWQGNLENGGWQRGETFTR